MWALITDGKNLNASADLGKGTSSVASAGDRPAKRAHRNEVANVGSGLDTDDGVASAAERALKTIQWSAECTWNGERKGGRGLTNTSARTLTLINAAPPARILGSSERILRTSPA